MHLNKRNKKELTYFFWACAFLYFSRGYSQEECLLCGGTFDQLTTADCCKGEYCLDCMKRTYEEQEKCSYCKKPWKATPVCFIDTCPQKSKLHEEGDLTVHIQQHTKQFPVFDNSQENNSLRKYAIWHCELCNQPYNDYLAFDIELHFRTHHPDEKNIAFKYACPIPTCSAKNLLFEDFKSHVTENFDRHITERSTSPANNKRQRLDHSTTSRNYAYWYCPECNSLFRGFFAYDIEAHMAKRHPEADYHHLAFKYSCGFSDCKYVNLGFSELQKHLLIAHKDSFLYKMPSAYSRVHSHWFCKDCNKGYKDALVIQIDQHLKTHGKGHLTNDFLYRCANKHCTSNSRKPDSDWRIFS